MRIKNEILTVATINISKKQVIGLVCREEEHSNHIPTEAPPSAQTENMKGAPIYNIQAQLST